MISGVYSSSSLPRRSTLQFARAHDAERAVIIRHQRVAVEGVVAQAEEGEIVGQQPLQEMDGLGDLVDRQRRRIALELVDDGVDALEHGAPVGHRRAHLREHGGKRLHDRGAGVRFERSEMDVDEALARAAAGVGRAEAGQLAGAVARDAEHRMRHQPHLEPAFGDFAHHRVDQKRHVVVDDVDHRHRFALAGVRERDRLATQLRRARVARLQEIPGAAGQHGEIGGAVARQVFRHRAREQLRRKAGRRRWRTPKLAAAPGCSRRGSSAVNGTSPVAKSKAANAGVFTFRAGASRSTHHLVTRPARQAFAGRGQPR